MATILTADKDLLDPLRLPVGVKDEVMEAQEIAEDLLPPTAKQARQASSVASRAG